MKKGFLAFVLAVAGVGGPAMAVTVTAKNDLDIPRPSETIDLKWADVAALLPKSTKADRVVVTDADGKQVVSQPIFFHGQKKPADEFIFQADFGPGETKSFTIEPGMPDPYEPKVYGRWVPERHDDFGWENDRIGYRIYGPELEKVEPACSGVDVWPKRTRNLIINKWYQLAQSINDNYYHLDRGEGLDCYKVGHGQGCGGTCVWFNGKRYTTGIKGWQKQRVLANGPIRLVFELTYDPIDVEGTQVSEVKRVMLDAGQNLNHYLSTFTTDKPDPDLTIAVGIGEHTDRPFTKSFHKDQGWMSDWDAGDINQVTKTETPDFNGHVGCGVVINPAQVIDMFEAEDQLLATTKNPSDRPVDFWAGAGWDKSGDFASNADWDNYLAEFSKRIQSPITISISK